ncbi:MULTISPECIES: hypothetical protein [Cyanophyceae]|nr:hypothetical protein [Trichocoleus sp. FACHB-40]
MVRWDALQKPSLPKNEGSPVEALTQGWMKTPDVEGGRIKAA